MTISTLLGDFISFAKGMPAIAISWVAVINDVNGLSFALSGENPSNPAPSMANIPLPVYSLAYSVFVQDLNISHVGSAVELTAKMIANVHPLNQPSQVIRSYLIETTQPASINLGYNMQTNEVFWQQQGNALPNITPSWGAEYQAVLATTSLPSPQDSSYLQDVEQQIIWLTGPSFVNLVAAALPSYNLADIAPWLKLSAPLLIDFSPLYHFILTSSHATITVGDCSPQTIAVVPDPDFPYGESIPSTTAATSNEAVFAVYAPKSRLIDFFSGQLEPAVVVYESGSGGIIKWTFGGSVGLSSLIVDISTTAGTSGVLSLSAGVNLVGAAQAWIDGPSGMHLSVADGSVLGTGSVSADIVITLNIATGYVDATLTIKQCTVNPQWDVHLLFPLNGVADEILNALTTNEAAKLAGSTVRLGHWEVMGPISQSERKWMKEARAMSEGLAGVCAYVGLEAQW
jgi:hypothetical protein